jgi:uncharacterized protein YdhG (YjbR/CyaY superfamily)
MTKPDVKTVREYIARQPEAAQAILERVRKAIRKALPGSEEVISYRMPAYRLHGEVVLYFAGWKKHYSLYPADEQIIAAFEDDLAPYEVDKGTIRFPLAEPVPVKLIEGIAKLRAREVAEREKTKMAP